MSAAAASTSSAGYYASLSFQEALEDLSIRFIVNLPADELSSIQRIGFQVEQAHWFYEDFVRPLNPTLPSHALRRFSSLLLRTAAQTVPLIERYVSSGDDGLEAAFDDFLRYKVRVPVCGAALLNKQCDKVLLVKGWKSASPWGFPKGKINQNEPPVKCAVREVWEETGYDCAHLISDEPADSHEVSVKEQRFRLFFVRGVDEDTVFEAKSRKEISKIAWFPLSELPTWKSSKAAGGGAGGVASRSPAGKFYLVSLFVGRLKAWVQEQKRRDAQLEGVPRSSTPTAPAAQRRQMANGVPTESSANRVAAAAPTTSSIPTLDAGPPPSSAKDDADVSGLLKNMLGIAPRPQDSGQPAPTAASHAHDVGGGASWSERDVPPSALAPPAATTTAEDALRQSVGAHMLREAGDDRGKELLRLINGQVDAVTARGGGNEAMHPAGLRMSERAAPATSTGSEGAAQHSGVGAANEAGAADRAKELLRLLAGDGTGGGGDRGGGEGGDEAGESAAPLRAPRAQPAVNLKQLLGLASPVPSGGEAALAARPPQQQQHPYHHQQGPAVSSPLVHETRPSDQSTLHSALGGEGAGRRAEPDVRERQREAQRQALLRNILNAGIGTGGDGGAVSAVTPTATGSATATAATPPPAAAVRSGAQQHDLLNILVGGRRADTAGEATTEAAAKTASPRRSPSTTQLPQPPRGDGRIDSLLDGILHGTRTVAPSAASASTWPMPESVPRSSQPRHTASPSSSMSPHATWRTPAAEGGESGGSLAQLRAGSSSSLLPDRTGVFAAGQLNGGGGGGVATTTPSSSSLLALLRNGGPDAPPGAAGGDGGVEDVPTRGGSSREPQSHVGAPLPPPPARPAPSHEQLLLSLLSSGGPSAGGPGAVDGRVPADGVAGGGSGVPISFAARAPLLDGGSGGLGGAGGALDLRTPHDASDATAAGAHARASAAARAGAADVTNAASLASLLML